MSTQLKIAVFCHSLVSDWNHGNAHFLRGLVRALGRMGHQVRSYEELGSWSLTNLMRSEGERAIEAVDHFRRSYPELDIRFYKSGDNLKHFLHEELRETDVVLLHEWNHPLVVNSVLDLKEKFGFIALLHDSHHRAFTQAGEMLRFQLHKLDGVLAFGEAVRRIYTDGFGLPRAWTFHEAADVDTFRPIERPRAIDVIWIGNWGDEERTHELQEYLIEPAAALKEKKVVVHGVRYPESALEKLRAAGVEYRGYLPNLFSPEAYAESAVALHVPRQQYVNGLSGIPTIRVFEALACGIPLVCSPWNDDEHLFYPGEDFLIVKDGKQMVAELQHLLRDSKARRQIAEHGLKTIRERHTCAHRAEQLISICEEIAA
ncbi:MAG TPA: glycosyltransferase [Candidatus Angelobacter sp.]|jgi:spore maturation protein CgeB|nr:glycosyltransferase [Candidatus Angelobacter sp.]